MPPSLKIGGKMMKLVSFLKKLGLAEGEQERLIREITKYFGLLPTQSELLRINKNLDVYPLYYSEYGKPVEHFFDVVFKDEVQLVVFDIFRTLYFLRERR
jgi:hypothetical protein